MHGGAILQDQQNLGSGVDRLQEANIGKDLAAHQLQEFQC